MLHILIKQNLNTLLQIRNFLIGNRWLKDFETRHNIVFKKTAEKNKFEQSVLPKDEINNISYKKNTIEKNKTQSKKCYTIFQCVNTTGTDQLSLFIIRKSKKSRCSKDAKSLPLNYISNAKA